MLRKFSELLQNLYLDTNSSTNWSTFLTSLKRITDSHSAVLYIGQPANCQIQRLLRVGVNSELNTQAYRELLSLSPFNGLPENEVLSLEDVSTRQVLMKSDFYRLCMLPHDIHYMLGANLYENSQQVGYLRIIRTRNGTRYGEKEKQLCSLMLPHIGNALHARTTMKSFQAEKLLFNQVLDRLEIGKLIVNSELEIVALNSTAETLLLNNGALLNHRGHLKAAKRDEHQLLRQVAYGLLNPSSNNTTVTRQAMTFKNHSGQPVIQALITSQQYFIDDAKASQCAVLFLTSMNHEVRLNGALLSELFGLTPSESSIAIALAKGLSVEEAADAADITLNTARTHIKGAFNKLGVTQQSMLVSRILTSVARFG